MINPPNNRFETDRFPCRFALGTWPLNWGDGHFDQGKSMFWEGGRNMSNTIIRAVVFLSLTICLSITTSCTVALRNHTAYEFPWTGRDKRPLSETLYPTSTPQEVVEASTDFKHKFLLEIKPDNGVSNVKAFVNVNGQEHVMIEHSGTTGKGLFVYVPTGLQCDVDAYEYFFRVGYNAGLYGWKTKYLKDQGDRSFKAPVLGAHRYVWWSGYHDPAIGNADILLRATMEGQGKQAKFYIQSLSSKPLRVSFIGLSTGGDAAKFNLVNMPVSRELACQGFLTFDLVWQPVPPDFEDIITLTFEVEFDMGGGHWVNDTAPVVINIRTKPYQPAF